jgi:predicted kinase
MKTLICTVGLPYSGKTTWARQQIHPIVNPDSIRLALHNQRYIEAAEPYVWAIAKTMVKSLFLAGHDTVILDATNITNKRREQWLSSQWETIFQVIYTPKEECISRATMQKDNAIIPIIEKMAGEFETFIEHPPIDYEIKCL